MNERLQDYLAAMVGAVSTGSPLAEADVIHLLRDLAQHCAQHQLPIEVRAFIKDSDLAKGENDDQSPASFWRDALDERLDPLGHHAFRVLAGDPSYNSICGVDHGLWILRFLAEAFRRWKGRVPYIVIICKHGDPCGAAFDWDDPNVAILKALQGDPLAVMGGELVCNFTIREEQANFIHAVPDGLSASVGRPLWGLDVISAEDFSELAVSILGGRKTNPRKLLANLALGNPTLPTQEWIYRTAQGGMLKQRTPNFVLGPDQATWIGTPLSDDDFADLLLAWACCWFGRSNTITMVNKAMLIGRGFGQQDRVRCFQLCLEHCWRSGHDTKGAKGASDGFYPFAERALPDYRELHHIMATTALCDYPRMDKIDELRRAIIRFDNREATQLLVDAGCIACVVPADGKKLADVQAYLQTHGISAGYTPKEHRGFRWH